MIQQSPKSRQTLHVVSLTVLQVLLLARLQEHQLVEDYLMATLCHAKQLKLLL